MTIVFDYDGPSRTLVDRELLSEPVATFHRRIIERMSRGDAGRGPSWHVQIGERLLFDTAGLTLIAQAIEHYTGHATTLRFGLKMDAPLSRDYYSLRPTNDAPIKLPIVARRDGSEAGESVTLDIRLPTTPDTMALPASMGGSMPLSVPSALLLPYETEFDPLFANQIAILSEIRRRVHCSPLTWIKAGVQSAKRGAFKERAVLAYRSIHPEARVHPTAIIEGSIIGAGAQIGAHCTVRYSVIGAGARLHDGAKVEFSAVGNRSWLMHDLVLYRSCVERDVFLIHGPYQFSLFQRGSSAFATILMDYRPDEKPIGVKTPERLLRYGGRFLGAVLGEGARVLGGCLLAPGRIVPAHTWLAADPSDIHTLSEDDYPRRTPISPKPLKRRHDEQLISG